MNDDESNDGGSALKYHGLNFLDHSWAEKPYTEIREIGEADGSILIVPVGSMEQHGYHMPVATDTILADAVPHLGAERVADSVPILVTPPIWTGYSPHHTAFGGTLTLDYTVLFHVLQNVLACGVENGFDAVLLLNGHGGNSSLISGAVRTVGEGVSDAEVMCLTYFSLAERFIDDVRESEIGGIGHAGELKTSLMLYLRPDLVDEAEAEGVNQNEVEPYDLMFSDLMESAPLLVDRSFKEYTESGAIGAPEVADREKGGVIFELLGDEMEVLLRDVYEHHR